MRALLCALVVVAGCGIGHSQSLDDAGAGGGGNDGGGLVSECGTSVPTSGKACSTPNLRCEYGSDPNLDCNTVAACAGGAWLVERSGGPNCPTPSGSKSCPSTYASVPVGKACLSQGTACGYPEGRCLCTMALSGPPQVGGDPHWFCDDPGAGCPSPRPRVGGACAEDHQFCDYGSCSLPGGTALRCETGRWVEAQVPCPL